MSVTPDNNRTSQNFFSQKKNRLHSQMLLLLLKPLTEKIVAVFQCRELFVLFFSLKLSFAKYFSENKTSYY